MRSSVAASIPTPVSETESKTYRPGVPVRMSPAKVLSNLDVTGLDDDAPALRHGISRVQTKIHEHLFDLRGISHGRLEARCECDLQFGLLSDGSFWETGDF